MRRLLSGSIVTACMLVAVSCASHEGTTTMTSASAGSALHDELLELARADRGIRKELMAKGIDNVTIEDVHRQDSVDLVNRTRLKQIVAEHGWPDPQRVGPDGVQAAFLIVQHAGRDPEFQQRMLPHIQKAFAAGILSGRDVALLTDRVLVSHGLPQRYGTQIAIVGGDVEVAPLEDSVRVDSLRARMQLSPLAEYVGALRRRYGLGQ